jgi:phosphatidylserine/phosphatidylglycerophosphate/cardiolipin synthase-like enzyme
MTLPAILGLCCLGMGFAPLAAAFQAAPAYPSGQAGVMAATGTVQVLFTPEEDASRVIEQAIHVARHQILVQAFSFTHRRISGALIVAKQRGVDVRVLADKDQTDRIPSSNDGGTWGTSFH